MWWGVYVLWLVILCSSCVTIGYVWRGIRYERANEAPMDLDDPFAWPTDYTGQ